MDSRAGLQIEIGPGTMQQILPSRVKMIKYRVLLSTLLLCLSCTAFAQVYKSTDDEGNVTFSDTPTDGGEAVQVEPTNVADPVEVPVNTAPPPEPKVVKTERAPEAPAVKDYADDDGYDGNRRVIRRHHRRMGHNRR
jgi:hypothetical protein